jgi:isopenicillin-N N-acyltransferase-like protein
VCGPSAAFTFLSPEFSLVPIPLSWPKVLDLAEEFRLTIRRLTPDIYHGIVGIAEGADLDILDIVAPNPRSEIALGRFTDGCINLSWNAKVESKDRMVLAQNWDWTARVKKNLVMMSIEDIGRPKIYMKTAVVGSLLKQNCFLR